MLQDPEARPSANELVQSLIEIEAKLRMSMATSKMAARSASSASKLVQQQQPPPLRPPTVPPIQALAAALVASVDDPMFDDGAMSGTGMSVAASSNVFSSDAGCVGVIGGGPSVGGVHQASSVNSFTSPAARIRGHGSVVLQEPVHEGEL